VDELEADCMTRRFDSVLVANRGEIAIRVMRTARELGYRVIAVYSEVDREAPHVNYADEALCIGAAPASESYLSMENVLAAARASAAQAIHPGYGFLSENADFARACEAAGVVFIGPQASAIELMGNKAAAKRQMLGASVPCVPGFEGENATDEELLAAARDMDLPLMVKAAAGGGGRGMVLVQSLSELPAALRSARSVALNSFGSDELILEKAVERPRHVEIQVFADTQGNVIHLGERDCSVQRRHQKVLEEAPCPVMTDALREQMGAAAVDAALAIGYQGAGTVEFLLDANGKFYFLEMNTRLQVEHPVTEMVTGLDLVALQLQVARGEPLGITQAQVSLRGHAMEARLYAEEPAKKFLPRTGTVTLWQPPEGARVDTGIATGYEVSPHYDPMLAKIIVWGEDRETARRNLLVALKDTVLFGVQSNRDFLVGLLQHPLFVDGLATTAFIEETYSAGDWPHNSAKELVLAVAAVLQTVLERNAALHRAVRVSSALLNWSSGEALLSRFQYGETKLRVRARVGDVFDVVEGEREVSVELQALDAHQAKVRIGSQSLDVYFHVPKPGEISLSLNGLSASFRNEYAFVEQAAAAAGSGRIDAPMHGVVLEVFVVVGEKVEKGQRLAVVEAMKMQHDILADVDGVVSEVSACAGVQVAANDLLVHIDKEHG
jgi:geranyl-CoA carboxylase alpha subunit